MADEVAGRVAGVPPVEALLDRRTGLGWGTVRGDGRQGRKATEWRRVGPLGGGKWPSLRRAKTPAPR
ncbi:MAG: hypothetical protein KatS3mg108_1443 [Isosphaeraceae bacterium]|nr:MAG: hypothetical protein KatS3mg108_1443 [Isosphaeraceae bacterium]